MKYDHIIGERGQRLDEFWMSLDKWLQGFLPNEDRDMFASSEEMERYIRKWITDFRKLAARYRDAEGKPITRKTLGKAPLNALRLHLSRVMQLPDSEIDAVLSAYNRHPMTKKSGLDLAEPLTASTMSSAVDAEGNPTTIEDYLAANAATQGSLAGWKSVEAFLDSLIATAATRKMEIHNLGDKGKRSAAKQDSPVDDEDDFEYDDLISRMNALKAGLGQIVRMDEDALPRIEETWHGGLSEGMMSTLAMIAEAEKPDVYSIVKRAHAQGHDASTIKQMLKVLNYPTGAVDKILAKLTARDTKQDPQAAAAQPQQPTQPQPQPRTIYVDRTGGATYDRPPTATSGVPRVKPSPPKRVTTGDDYVDGILNAALQAGGKDEAIKTAVTMLTAYERKRRMKDRGYPTVRDRVGKDREQRPDFARQILNFDKWLKNVSSGRRQ